MPGIRTSISTRSGRSIGQRTRTSSPLTATSTRVIPGIAATARRSVSRASGESSQTSTDAMRSVLQVRNGALCAVSAYTIGRIGARPER